LCIDLGSGTGAVGLFLLSKGFCARALFYDIVEKALLNSVYNLVLNKLAHRAIAILCDDAEASILEGSADLVAANPPYLPGVPCNEYEVALLGGPKGYETAVRFIRFAEKMLAKNGLLFITFSSLSDPEVIEAVLSEKYSIKAKQAKVFFYETLYVVEAEKK